MTNPAENFARSEPPSPPARRRAGESAGFGRLLATLMVLLGIALPASAQWVAMGGPLGGLGYDVRIHPQNKSIMYVTDNYAGVVVSNDAGANWRAANQGITVRAGPSGSAYPIFSLTVDPNNPNILWAGTNGEGGQYGIFKSIDAGSTWNLTATGISAAAYGIVFRGFTVQPGNSDIVYAMAELPSAIQGREFNRVQGQVYKTTDGGRSWSLLWQGNNLARYLIIDPIDSRILYLSTGIFDREAYDSDCANGIPGGVGVLKSTDGGASWTAVNSGFTNLYVGSLRMHPSNRSVLFAAAGNNACSGGFENNQQGGLFRTINGGASWTKVIANDILTTVNFAPANPDIVYAGSAAAFYRSTDGGLTWTTLSKPGGAAWGPIGVRAGVPIDVTIDPTDVNLLFANNYGGGVFRSADGAQTWSIWSKGYSGAQIHAAHIPPARPSSLLAIGRSGPFLSTNYGEDWTGIGTGDADIPEWNTLVSDPRDANIILLADEHQGKILRSTNSGGSFTTIFTQPQASAANAATRQGVKTFAVSPANPDVIYAGLARERGTLEQGGAPAGRVFYRSTDNGRTFSSPGSTLDGMNVRKLVAHPTQVDTLWAATSGGVYKSTNGGASWSPPSLSGRNITALAVDSASNTLVAGEKEIGIWTSENGGSTWSGPSVVGFNNANPYVMSLTFSDSSTLLAADYYSGTYRSTDRGRTWSPFPDTAMTGLAVRAAKDIVAANGVVYVATEGGGVFRYSALTNLSVMQAALFVNASTSTNKTSVVRVINTSGSSGTLTATAYDESGNTLGTAGAYLGTIAANQTLNLTSAQLESAIGFTPSAPTSKYSVYFSATVASFDVINYTQDRATGNKTLSQSLTQDRASGAAAVSVTRQAWFVSASTSANKTNVLRVINTSGQSGTVTATAYDEAGNVLGTAGTTLGSIGPHQMATYLSADLENTIGFRPAAPTAKYRVVFTANVPSLELINFTRDNATLNLALVQAQLEDRPAATAATSTRNALLIYPSTNSARLTMMRIVNPSNSIATLAATVYDEAGTALGSGSLGTVGPNQILALGSARIEALLGYSPTSSSAKYRLAISANVPTFEVINDSQVPATGNLYLAQAQTDNRAASSATSTTRKVHIIYPSTNAANTTQLQIINTTGQSAALTATAYDDDGNQIAAGRALGTLGANQMLTLASAQLQSLMSYTPPSSTAKWRMVISGALSNFEVINYARDASTGVLVLAQPQTE